MLGFWSYVHKDDEMDFGRVADLARDVVANYTAIRNEDIELFLDRDDLHWGDLWRDRVNDSLANVAFFVPVITPRYFQSVECRREFQFFLDRTEKLGIDQLVLPILYIDVPELADEHLANPLMIAARDRQWRTWTDLRFEDRTSGVYRRAVFELATEIARRAEAAEREAPAAAAIHEAEEAALDDAPGLIDRVAEFEEALPRWTKTVEALGMHVEEVGKIMKQATQDTQKANSQGKGFAARLQIARRVAIELEAPVAHIEELAESWVADLQTIDSGARALLERAQLAYDEDPDATRTFLRSIVGLSQNAGKGLASTSVMINGMGDLASQSRDLRPILRRLQRSLTPMAEARSITDAWEGLVEETGLLDPPAEAFLPTDMNDDRA